MKKILISLLCLGALSACPAEENTQQTQDAPPSGVATTETHGSGDKDKVLPVGNAEAGPQVFIAKGCTACHAISGLPEAKGQIGPVLDGIGTTAASRVEGLDAEGYLKQSIEEPGAYVVEGYQNLMAKGLRDQMSEQEYADLMAYLLTLKS